MPHFLINSNNVKNNLLRAENEELIRHLALSLRVKSGDCVKFIDENKIQYYTKILSVSKKGIEAEITGREPSKRELLYNIFLAQSVLKTDAQNLLISNAAQLGVKGVYPFLSEFCAVKKDIAFLKNEKWQKIADEAFKQCERADRMQVFGVLGLVDILSKFKRENVIIFAESSENTDIRGAVADISKEDDILVVTGPEGGFSEKEFEYFKENGYKLATLGNLIFKAPNAVTAGVSNVIFALDLKNKGE